MLVVVAVPHITSGREVRQNTFHDALNWHLFLTQWHKTTQNSARQAPLDIAATLTSWGAVTSGVAVRRAPFTFGF